MHHGVLTSRSDTIYVNRQVGAEFIDQMHRTAPIKLVVVDFDFRHVVETLNRLTPGELRTLEKLEQVTKKSTVDRTEHTEDVHAPKTSKSSQKKEPRTQEEADNSNHRKFTLELKITHMPKSESDLGRGINCWLSHFNGRSYDAWKQADFGYPVIGTAKPELGVRKVTLPLEHWEEKLQKFERDSDRVDGRAMREVQKITKAITE